MPNKVEFEAGKLSLIPDPLDSYSGIIAIYLVNATDEKVNGVDPNDPYCFLEVKDGNRWRACERFIPGCGTGFSLSSPAGLKGRDAAIFFGIDPSQGDLSGELRFCTASEGFRPIVSASFQGRYSSERFKTAALPPTPVSESITAGLADMVSGKVDGESPRGIARSPEEYIAAGELERCYDESIATKAALIRWQEHPSSAECRTALTALLQKTWDKQLDAPALFNRCFTALTRRDAKQLEFGSPERCRAMVWRYLSVFRSEWHELLINPERWDQLKKIKVSGNPWGVDEKLVATLVEEAVTSLRSTDPNEQQAAGAFLNGYWIKEKHLPDAQYWLLIDQGITNLRTAAVSALTRRGKGQQAGKWLLDHRDLPAKELAFLWGKAVQDPRSFADWELPMGLHLLGSSPFDAVSVLGTRRDEINRDGGKLLPIEIRAPLRRFLEKEAGEKRVIGLPPPESVASLYTNARYSAPRYFEQEQLVRALHLLAAWKDPADTPLLQSYLAHPAVHYEETSDQNILRRYAMRSTAARLLKERNEEIPEGIVFEEKVETK
ncbi:MAG TPA: hypothetical protein VGE67_15490 [Haloferula sp.]